MFRWNVNMVRNLWEKRRGFLPCLMFGMPALTALMFSGCAIVPFPTSVESLPFPDELMLHIVPGETSRQQVIDLLGNPSFESPGSSRVLYGANRRVAGMLAIAQNGMGTEPVNTGHLLVLGYDSSDIVQEIDLFRNGLLGRNAEVCTTSEICIKPQTSRGTSGYQILGAKFYDSPESDSQAKSLVAATGQCSVYVYLDTNFLSGEEILIHTVGIYNPEVRLHEAGYFWWRQTAGPMNISASNLFESGNGFTFPPPGKQALPTSLSISTPWSWRWLRMSK